MQSPSPTADGWVLDPRAQHLALIGNKPEPLPWITGSGVGRVASRQEAGATQIRERTQTRRPHGVHEGRHENRRDIGGREAGKERGWRTEAASGQVRKGPQPAEERTKPRRTRDGHWL